MTQILAINSASKEVVERMQMEVMKQEFAEFIKTDPEVRQMMLARVADTIAKLGNWEITYHGGFKEMFAEIFKQPELKSALDAAAKRILQEPSGDLNYSIVQALGEYLAGRITMTLPKDAV